LVIISNLLFFTIWVILILFGGGIDWGLIIGKVGPGGYSKFPYFVLPQFLYYWPTSNLF